MPCVEPPSLKDPCDDDALGTDRPGPPSRLLCQCFSTFWASCRAPRPSCLTWRPLSRKPRQPLRSTTRPTSSARATSNEAARETAAAAKGATSGTCARSPARFVS
jgi:hypothetical protein